MYRCIPPGAENGFSTNEGLYCGCVCVLLLYVSELLLWEFLSTRLWLMRGGSNTYKQSPSCVKSGNFITKTQHEDRRQVDTVTDKYRMNVRPPA